MPEEKKEKFTFSDKIKASKPASKSAAKSAAKPEGTKPVNRPAGSKPFAKSASKIGRDGKPKQTLFERTRRDAPFFIAALVALLLLPFLYKYSGQSSEEEFLAPVAEENIFNPDQFGFNTAYTEDPDGQIAQLSGRDSLSLIRGFGSADEDYGRDDLDFDTSTASTSDYDYSGDAEGKYAAAHHESSDMDIENNTTNIYKRRAKRSTRAAFKRAATKVGTLNPATMRRAGGGPLGVKNWGGGMKQAAQRVKSSAPKEGPKPVSLQPLRAKSGRSSFGGTGKAGRKSRDAMGKSDARAALRDANVKPVDPTRVGGLDMFAMGPGGGNGRLERNINIAPGKEPWWWDMMKTRMQKEWEKNFERKWKWIDWADEIAMNILKGLINCLITGDSDGDVDNFLGKFGTNSSVEETCCGKTAKKLDPQKLAQVGGSVKKYCDVVEWKQALKDAGADCSKGYKGASGASAEVNMGPIGQRLCCLGFCGAGFAGSASGSIDEGNGLPCADISNHRYHLETYKLPRKWQKHTYIYVVARNYRPANYPALDERAGRGFLCAKDGIFNIGGEASAGADNVNIAALRDNGDEPNNFYKGHKKSVTHSKEQQIVADMYDLNREDIHDGCVIYIQRGNTFNYDNFQANMVQAFKKVLKKSGVKSDELDKRARDSFNNLDLMFIEGFASQHKLAYAKWFETGNNLHEILPMVYWRFYDTFVEHRGSTNKADGTRVNVDNRKMRIWGGDSGMGDRCYFEDSMSLECMEQEKPQLIVHVNLNKYKGGDVLLNGSDVLAEAISKFAVTAAYRPLNADDKFVETEQPLDVKPPVLGQDQKSLIYTFTDVVNRARTDKETLGTGDSKIGYIKWSVDRKDNSDTQHMLTVTCPYNLSGDLSTPPIEEKECKNAQQSEKCCLEINGADYMWDASKPVGSQCVKKPVDECPEKENTSAKCCKDIMGPNYLFDENHNPKCYLPGTQTRLAPVLSWVPYNGKTDCRAEAGNEANPPESTFAQCPKVPGIVKDKTQNCGSQQPMMMDSAAAAKFVKDVVTAYNNNLPQGAKKLSDKFYGGNYPTDGEFVDAMFIANKNSSITGMPQQVPAAAVCELGRDMVRMSRDKHTKEMKVASPLDTPYGSGAWKDSNTVFHNELGAFLAYIHMESIFYPQKFFGNMQQCDYRFQVTGEAGCPARVNWSSESCKYSGSQKCKEYHHNNYNNIPTHGAQATAAYPPSLAPIQSKGKFLLKGLVSGKSFPQVGNSGGSTKGKAYINNISLLLREGSGFEAWQGKACEAFEGSSNMLQVSDVLKYVETVCSVGLDFKPYGSPGSQRGTSPAPGTPGADTGTPAR